MKADFYTGGHRELQERFETRKLADVVNKVIVHDEVTDEEKAYIESKDMFFMATVDERGRPQCSYKGGDPGFVRVVDKKTIAFPCYDGNGMFLSMGNVMTSERVGLLFIDFEKPHRLRLNGTATIHFDDELLPEYHEAQFIVRIAVEEIFVNCPRYIHKLEKVEHSVYVPNPSRETPIPEWKKKEALHDVLPERDRKKLAAQRS